MTALLDGRPPALDAFYRPGKTFTHTSTWTAGYLAGRTFTASLDGVLLAVTIDGDTMTITASAVQTTTAGDGEHTFELTETTGGMTEPAVIGSWSGSDRAATSGRTTVNVTDSAGTVEVTVLGNTPRPNTPDLRGQDSEWAEIVFSTHDASCPATAVTFEHGQLVARGSGAGSGTRSGRRTVLVVPGSPGGYSRIRSRWSGAGTAGPLVPQRGHMHGIGDQADGMRRGVIFWHDIVFSAPWVFNLAVWHTDPADLANGFVVNNGALTDRANVTAAARASNVVTLTVPAGHGFGPGDVVTVDLSDNTFDGAFAVTATTATTVVYDQQGSDDASGGTGSVGLARNGLTKSGLIRQVAASAAVRATGVVTATVPAGHPFELGDWVTVDLSDNTYDGAFAVTAVTATSVSWRQTAADDASAGTGTVGKVLPYWAESEWTPGLLRARVWPDTGAAGGSGGTGIAGPPPWESAWSVSVDLTGVTEPDPGRGVGCGLLAGHLAAGPTVTEVRYDNIETAAL